MGTAKVQGELWGARSSAWADKQEPTGRPLWARMLEVADVRAGDSVVDLGCGSGHALAMAKALGATVAGLDASQALLTHARLRVPDAELVEGELEELPFLAGRFDVVMAANSLQYAADRHRAARELVRIRKADGRIVVGMWAEPEKNEMTAVLGAIRALAPPPPGAPQPLDLASRDNLLGLLVDAGMTIAEDGEVECVFAYPDEAEYLAAQTSAGPLIAAARVAGEDRVVQTLREVARPFTAADGSIRFVNRMRYVLAR